MHIYICLKDKQYIDKIYQIFLKKNATFICIRSNMTVV